MAKKCKENWRTPPPLIFGRIQGLDEKLQMMQNQVNGILDTVTVSYCSPRSCVRADPFLVMVLVFHKRVSCHLLPRRNCISVEIQRGQSHGNLDGRCYIRTGTGI